MRYFKKRVKAEKVFEIWGYDTEDNGEGDIIGWALVNAHTGEVITGREGKDFRRLLKNRMFLNCCFVAHNAEYDIGNIWGLDHLHEFSKYWVSGSQFKFASLPIDSKNNITFFDTFNHYAKSLKKMAKTINMEKGEDAGLDAPWKERKEYCIQDARICAEFAKRLQILYNDMGTSLRATVGASAMELYTRKYMEIEYHEVDMTKLWYFKRGFTGGRTECFRIGTFMTKEREKYLLENEPDYLEMIGKYHLTDEIYYYDINNLYGYLEKILNFPNPDTLILKKNPRPNCLEYEGASNVEVEVNTNFPILPYRGSKLVFPNGKFRAIYPNNLIRYAMEHDLCKVKKIISTCSATESGPFLRRYVDSLYAMRLMYKKDSFEEQVIKKLIVSLYGKFGQMGKNESYDREARQFKKEKTILPVYTNMIWPSMITGGGYTVMDPYLNEYVFDIDTDGIKTSKKLPDNMISTELGKMKEEEGSPFDEGRFLLPKMNWLKGKIIDIYTAKGFPKEMVYDGRFPGREALEKGWAAFRKPHRMRESIRRGLKLNEWEWTTKTVRAHYDKRHIRSDGSTYPLTVNGG